MEKLAQSRALLADLVAREAQERSHNGEVELLTVNNSGTRITTEVADNLLHWGQ